MLDKAIRDLDRERMGLQNQEKKLVAEIKKAAKQGQMVRVSSSCPSLLHWMEVQSLCCLGATLGEIDCFGHVTARTVCDDGTFGLQEAVKVMAKSLVRNRHAVTKMYGLKSQLQAVSLRIAVRPPIPIVSSRVLRQPSVLNHVHGLQSRWSAV